MRQRIRAAALITCGDSILLVKHRGNRDRNYFWWVPPGGGVEGSESLTECAEREVLEETGLIVQVGKLIYLREFIERPTDTHHIEAFFSAEITGGSLRTGDQPDVSEYVHEIEAVHFIDRDELQTITVFPEELKSRFWKDLGSGFTRTRYLGLKVDHG